MKNLVRDITALGGSFFYFLLVIFAFLLEKGNIAVLLVFGYICIHVIAIPLRFLFFCERPIPRPTNTIVQKIDAASFPSLHAARASYIGALFFSYWGSSVAGGLIIALTGIILWSRYYLKEHRIGDIIAGMIIGLGFAFLVHYIA